MAEPTRTLPTEQNAPTSRGAREGARVELVKKPKGFVPRFATREEGRAALRQISEDHSEIIKALAK